MDKKSSRSHSSIATAVAIFALSCQLAWAGELTTPNTFSAGQDATAASVNANFVAVETAVNDNNSRISTLESASNQVFTGYTLPFSEIGQPKNVIIQKTMVDPNTGQYAYAIRTRYQSDSETIQVDGLPVSRTYFVTYPYVVMDSSGPVRISNSIDSPDTPDYINVKVENSTYDTGSLVKTVTEDFSRTYDCAGDGTNTRNCSTIDTSNSDSSFINSNSELSVTILAGARTYNGMSFPDVAFLHRVRASSGSTLTGELRIRAKGIGEVKRVRGGDVREIVYYQVNGQTGGILPAVFASGGALEGLFF